MNYKDEAATPKDLVFIQNITEGFDPFFFKRQSLHFKIRIAIY